MKKNNIAIIWDFDKTLTPQDSTSEVIKILFGQDQAKFWGKVKKLKRVEKLGQKDHEHVLGSDAPIWMYALSREAFKKRIPLNEETFKFMVEKIDLYSNVTKFLKSLQKLSSSKEFKQENLVVNHFIVSAGLQDLIKQVFPKGTVKWVFGCRYEIIVDEDDKQSPESIPVYCIDETMKTRSIFEISKGTFLNTNKHVNNKIKESDLFVPFKNMIYIGDGFSDVPSFSLVRSKGGVGVAVYDPKLPKDKKKKAEFLRLVSDERVDYVSSADFTLNGDLYTYIKDRCLNICDRYKASNKKTALK